MRHSCSCRLRYHRCLFLHSNHTRRRRRPDRILEYEHRSVGCALLVVSPCPHRGSKSPMGTIHDHCPLLHPRHPNNNSFLRGYPSRSILSRSCSRLESDTYVLLYGGGPSIQVYIGGAFVNLRPVLAVKNKEGRKMMLHLFLVYIPLIVLPGTLLMLDYAHFYFVEIAYGPFVYSLKLRMEFEILTKLVCLVTVLPDGLQPLNPSHTSNALPLDTYSSIANHTPDSGTSTPGLDPMQQILRSFLTVVALLTPPSPRYL